MDRGKQRALGMLLLAVLLGSSSSAVAGPRDEWKKGLACSEDKLYVDAVGYYTQALKTNNGDIPFADVAKIFNSRGLAWLGLNNVDNAIDDFSNAIELDEKNPEFFLNRANTLLGRKHYGRARDDFSSVIALDPRSAAAYAGRARTNREDRSYASAISDYRKLLELEPRNVDALRGLGLAYKNDHQDAKAIETFNELLAIDPRNAEASYLNAGLFARAGKIDAGCVWLEEAVAKGYRDWETMKNDPDLDALRKTSCYQKALGGH